MNEERREAFLAEVGGNLYTDMMATYGSTRLETKAKQFDFTHVNDRSGPLPKIDKEWLANADLVRIDAVRIGTQQSDFEIETFSLSSQSTAGSHEIDKMDQQSFTRHPYPSIS